MAPGSQNNNNSEDKNNNSNDSNNDNQTLSNDLTKEMQQYYMKIVKRHVHDNSSYNRVWKKYATDTTALSGKKKYSKYKIDFNDFDDEFLRLYKDRYKLNDLKDNYTFNGFLLQTDLGSKTYSYKKNNKSKFVPKPISNTNNSNNEDNIKEDINAKEDMNSKEVTPDENAAHRLLQLKENLNNTVIKGNRTSKEEENFQVKETEAISQFVYKVKKDNKKFKLEF
ncbi:hypothetical protein ACO0SA_003566 [Hanseniaspora valbyensis]